jgi:hypothetical protein
MEDELKPLSTEPVGHPQWIPFIDQYCDRRCERCEFNQRCRAHASQQRLLAIVDNPALETDDPDDPPPSTPGWAERNGVDLGDFEPTEELREWRNRRQKCDNEPAVLAAMEYATDVWNVLKLVEDRSDLSPAVTEAIDDISWCCTMIAAKVRRAYSAHDYLDEDDVDPVQNDVSGSAKISRIMIERSSIAWDVVVRAGDVLDSALVLHLVAVLQQIDAELAARFPHAMAFVRPGFDEEIPGIVPMWTLSPEEEDGR